MYSFFSKMAIYVSLKDKRDAVKEMGISPYALNDYKEAATKYAAPKVERIITYLRDVDKKTKGIGNSSASDGDLMKELIFKILH
jgi:DNA polymerase III subunit delta